MPSNSNDNCRLTSCVCKKVLSLQIPLATMLAYLESSMRSANQQRRSASIVKSLRRSENFQVQEDNVKCKDRYTKSRPADCESIFILLSLYYWLCAFLELKPESDLACRCNAIIGWCPSKQHHLTIWFDLSKEPLRQGQGLRNKLLSQMCLLKCRGKGCSSKSCWLNGETNLNTAPEHNTGANWR